MVSVSRFFSDFELGKAGLPPSVTRASEALTGLVNQKYLEHRFFRSIPLAP